ncbi:MAG: tripartite tricarboxylate transporter substrate binding protein [Betaproteobacteria bacterium]|nr:tripartite tricarboxylate transporter substrate binding protein [Betaproteobacteria bacterium]
MSKLLALVVTSLVTGLAFAQAYPSKPIKLIHGFVPGGNVDITARVVGQPMSEILGQPMVVEGRPGAGGTVAANAVARSDPDGYTLFMMASGHSFSPGLYVSLPYDPANDFTMISLAAQFPFVIAVAPNHPAKSLGDLIAQARAKKGDVTLAHAGVGTGMHLATVLLQSRAGIQFNLIPYKGGNLAPMAVAQGETQVVFDTPAGMASLIKGGRLRPLAVSSASRWKNWPDVATVAESVPGFDVRGWMALAGPKNLPQPVVERLRKAMHQALARQDVIERFSQMGTGVAPTAPAETQAFLTSEIERWKKVVREAGIKPQN